MLISLPILIATVCVAQTGGPTVSILKDRFTSALTDADRGAALDEISKSKPVSAQDVSALFDLFSRFPNPDARKAAMSSLSLIAPGSPQLEPLFIQYLQQPEPETRLFGINGAFRIRSQTALPMIRQIAEKKFVAGNLNAITTLVDRNEWWTQYEALSALSQWPGVDALPLLRKKIKESPAIARLLGQAYWVAEFPTFKAWVGSKERSDFDRALEFAGATITREDATATKAAMLEMVRDIKLDQELRHRLALKVGSASTGADVDALIAAHDGAGDESSRLIWASAVFASRSPNAAPLLARYAREAKDETYRAAAADELRDIVGPDAAAKMIGAPAPPK